MGWVSLKQRDKIVKDVGLLILRFAKLEFEIDELLCLAQARFPDISQAYKRYPVQWNDKISAVQWIEDKISQAHTDRIAVNELLEVKDVRDRIVHGKVIQPRSTDDEYSFLIIKLSMPARDGTGQRLIRSQGDRVRDRDLEHAQYYLLSSLKSIETTTMKTFFSGSGWLGYIPDNSQDQFGLLMEDD
ncbi:hypothetical protein [Paracoccus fontiphilus]|uniref:Apea-like HEPN domain-containing protein n=1 Tax=Paracoccus fontiphilus TaxID=1815556 RepID=A0ABV7ICX0_9RHOB|nr:hypothetical protein [Paracoccus fontiphilus]